MAPANGSTVRARLADWDAVQENNAARYPDPALPTYEGLDEFVEGTLSIEHIAPGQGIDYVRYSVAGRDVDPDSIEEIG